MPRHGESLSAILGPPRNSVNDRTVYLGFWVVIVHGHSIHNPKSIRNRKVLMKILTAQHMGEVDRRTWELYRIPSLLLMENAGRAAADELEKAQSKLPGKSVYILCGKGNNGGDGLVAARYLALRGGRPEVFMFCDPANLRGDALTNWEIVRSLDIKTVILPKAADVAAQLKK